MTALMEKFFTKILELRWYVLIFFAIILLFGLYSLRQVKIDAIPDITNKQVVINTRTFGMEPTRIEKSVTYPIEAELFGIPGIKEIRSISKFGLSQVILIFSDDIDIYFARNQVLQRISSIGDQIPSNLKPQIGPLTTGIGEILMYRVYEEGVSDDLMKLRTVQQFEIAREIKKIKGVAEVDTIGGFERELHLNVNPEKIVNYGLSLKSLVEKIKTVGENVGGGYIEQENQQKIVRTFSGVKTFDDIMNLPVKIDYSGKNLSLNHVVEVRQDFSQRLGAASYKGQETVIGTVMLQSGENAKDVLIEVKKAVNKWNKNNNVKVDILYDRQFLIDSTIKTVVKNLTEGVLLVVGVLFLLLGSFKVGFIVALSLPFAILILASCMNIFGISANLMSLGAIDFGLIVDSSVVLIEFLIANIILIKSSENRILNLAKLCAKVSKPIFFGITIIILVYVPILMFSGIEGKTFKPMAINVIIGMFGSLLIAFLLMPVLTFFFIKDSSDHENFVFTKLKEIYKRILTNAIKKNKMVMILCSTFFVFSVILFLSMSSDFLPELNEGDLVYTIVADDNTSLNKTKDIIQELEKKLSLEKEIEKTFSRVGISQSGLDLMPQNSADLFVVLKNKHKEEASKVGGYIYNKIKKELDTLCNSCEISESQPIKMRFNEMLEGSRADLSLRIFGEDLNILMEVTHKITNLLGKDTQIKGIEQDFVNSIRRGKFINVEPNYFEIAHQQISIADVNSEVQNAMAGIKVGNFYATEFPISIVLHLNENHRNDLKSISNIPVAVSDGGSFPLSRVANITENEDVTSIPRLFGKRYSSISIYLNDTNYGQFIKKSENEIIKKNILPNGYKIEWGGRFENFNSAKKQILIVIPVIILMIFLILFKMFNNIGKVLVIFSAVPFAISGAILMLFIFQIPITISVYIGFIALIGISILNSIILLDTVENSENLYEACISRLRPILMTATVASLGFIPMAFGNGIGSEVQQPIAIAVIGGIISSTFSTLILNPVLLKRFIFK